MKYTVLGGYGFVGKHLLRKMRDLGLECWAPKRGDEEIYNKPLGTVFYCIGMTADYRRYPLETIESHIEVLKGILKKDNFDKLIYLSSTRVYLNCKSTNEDSPLIVEPRLADNLYNISKIMGESATLSSTKKCVVVRLSNVIGRDMGETNFIGSLLSEATKTKKLHFLTGKDSEKDYIWIDDLISVLIKLGCESDMPNKIYNACSGHNISNLDLAGIFSSEGIDVTFEPNVPNIKFTIVNNERLREDTGYAVDSCFDRLREFISDELK
jgi:nucleoside-diphosphate-sugar epimerase